jgi:hypothetical protein
MLNIKQKRFLSNLKADITNIILYRMILIQDDYFVYSMSNWLNERFAREVKKWN